MLKRRFLIAFACVLLTLLCTSVVADARPSWITVSYSGFTIHKNPNQTNLDSPGYYYANIIATCVNNSTDRIITGVTSRSMGFNAIASGNNVDLGTATGTISIDEPSTLEPVHPGEAFTIEYNIPVLYINDAGTSLFNRSENPRLRTYNLTHDFQVSEQ